MKNSLGIVDHDGILICRGRLQCSELNMNAKFPIVLPNDNHFTNLVIMHCHEQVFHCKVKGTLAELRSRFWVTQGRQYVKKVIKNCFICKKLEGKSFGSPPIAPLPDFRVSQALPFSKVGVDFAGPLYIKKEGKMEKAYVALFTCCVTRAVHLELVENLNASTFLNCLRRFSARRGTPTLIVSDNGKTFKATDLLQNYLSSKRICWRFNLERAAWMGGFFERLISSMKRCLRKVLGNAKLTSDELITVSTEIECTLNSRPITYQNEDLEEALTPSHLQLGHRLSRIAKSIDSSVTDDYNDYDKLMNRFKYLSRKLFHFLKRWKHEYLINLGEHHNQKKNSVQPDISVGDIVLIQDEGKKRGLWKMGLVENLITGKDGVVRGATGRKSNNGKTETLNRSVLKLFPLEIASTESGGAIGNVESSDESRDVSKGDGASETTQGAGEATSIRSQPTRAAAKDARWKSRLMLDS